MSKLFDRIDCAWEIAQIDRAEQEAASELTGFQLARLEQVGRSDRYRLQKSKVGPAVGQFERLRRRSRMKLLESGQLMRDARFASGVIGRCGRCHVDGEKHRYCQAHRNFGIVFQRLKWAGEANMATRLAQGRVWGDDTLELEERGLNEWEQWYYRDKQEGVWPGTHAYTGTAANLDWLRREYGSLDYRGWLQMMLEEEEMPLAAYEAEKARLNDASNCA